MNRDEAVQHRHAFLGPVDAGMEAERLAGFLDQRVGLHVVVVVHGILAHRRDREADHAGLVDEFLGNVVGGFGIVERQVHQRPDPRILRQDAIDQPAIIGARKLHLDLDLRMHAQAQHRGGEHHRDIDAHRVHPALRECHVAMHRAGRRLFHLAQRIAHDAPGDFLVADRSGKEAGALLPGERGAARDLLQHGIIEIFEDLRHRLGFVVMRVDVHDRELVVPALLSLALGVGEKLAGIEFLDAHRPVVAQRQVHGETPVVRGRDWGRLSGVR